MGSSYRSDLNCGSGNTKDWAEKLSEACLLIEQVRKEVSDCIGSDGQFDNAAEDGALQEKLGLAQMFLMDELGAKQKTELSARIRKVWLPFEQAAG